MPILARKHFESPKQARWALKLQDFDFRLRHLPGSKNCVADALSRNELAELVAIPPADVKFLYEEILPSGEVRLVDDGSSDNHFAKQDELNAKTDQILGPFDRDFLFAKGTCESALARCQRESPHIQELWEYRKKIEQLPEDNAFFRIRHKITFTDLKGQRALAQVNGKYLVPPEAETRALRAMHGDIVTHLSVDTMTRRMEHLYFPQKQEKIRAFVANCPACIHSHTKLAPLPVSHYPDGRGKCIAMDLVELHWKDLQTAECRICSPRSSAARCTCLLQSTLQRSGSFAVLEDKRAETVAEAFLNEVIPFTGVPHRVLTDRGTDFVNEVFELVFLACDTEHYPVTPGNKCGNGVTKT